MTPTISPLAASPAPPLPEPVTGLFLRQVQQTPFAPALEEAGRSVRYTELAAMAGGVVAGIRGRGCVPGDIVAIHGRRGSRFVASLIGIMFARCIALPLSASHPSGWRRDILAQAAVKLLIDCGGAGEPSVDVPSLPFGPDTDSEDKFEDLLREPPPTLFDPAYLFFTSGTAGRPKGVLGSHGGLGQFIRWQGKTFDLGSEDRVAHITGLGFDVVLREIFLPLTTGAALIIPDPPTLDDPYRLVSWLERERITRLHAVPTVAAAWLAEAGASIRLPNLRTTFFAGEPLTRSLVQRWRDRLAPSGEVINLYGPTETTLAKCWYRVPPVLATESVPVGMPLPECTIVLCDTEGKEVSPGASGEVEIRTPWCSLGYLNQDSPFRPDPSGRPNRVPVYRTGDRGRLLPDGNLELLGRIDDQVKIRGVRIEPVGVATRLGTHPAVRDCTVLAIPGDPSPRLAAFVVGVADPAELRRHLASTLPDPMLPADYYFLQRLPTTPNGKLDRARLRSLATDRERSPDGAVPTADPPTPAERLLTEIIREVLQIPLVQPVSPEDGFFDLGGDSLSAMAVTSRVNQQTGLQLDAADIFEVPDIRGLAERLAALQGIAATGPGDAPVPVARSGRLPLAPSQERIWFQCQLEGEQAFSYNVPVTVAMQGSLDVAALEHAIGALIARHEVLRCRFPVEDGVATVAISQAIPFSLPVTDLGPVAEPGRREEAGRLARRQVKRPFRPDREALLRAELLRLEEQDHLLIMTIHHLVFDGWSRWLLLKELGDLYSSFARSEKPELPPLRLQYVDYAAWCRNRAPRPASLAWWRERLRGAGRADLPPDAPPCQTPAGMGAEVRRRLSRDLLVRFEDLCSRERTTLYMLLLTGFKLVLSRCCGTADLTIGSPVANRPHPELEPLLGCFIETLPIRTDLSGNPSCSDLIRRVREGVIGAFTHADVPFEKIVETVNPPRRADGHPLFSHLFNLVSVPRREVVFSGLNIDLPDLVAPESRFEVSLYARRSEDAIELNLVYRVDLFGEERMNQMLVDLESVLRQMTERPETPIGELQFGTAAPVGPHTTESNDRIDPEHRPFTAPRNAEEEGIAALFGELLGRGEVSVHDSFFALGGHSLLAARAVSRLRRRFHPDLPLRFLFAHQSVAELATAIMDFSPPREQVETREQATTPAQERLLGYMEANPCSTHFNVTRRVLLRGVLDANLLEAAIRRIVNHQPVFSTGYRLVDGALQAFRLEEEPTRLQQIDLRHHADPVVALERLVEEETARPFPLDTGPLLRATLLRTADAEQTLLVAVHHVSADCWSMGMPFGGQDGASRPWMAGVLFRQLWSVYHSLAAGLEPDLIKPPRQFDAVASLQKSWLAGDEAVRQISFWQELFADRPAPLVLPTDFPRPPAWDFQGERLRFCLDSELSTAARHLAARHETTLFVVLQAAFAALLGGLTGQTDIVTGTTAANRGQWEADDLVGFFSNNLPLRNDLAGNPTFSELIHRCHAAAFAAFSHQELPFEKLLDELQVRPEPDRHPLFQIRFLLHLPGDAPFVSENLTMQPVPIHREVAKYDLTLLLADDGQAIGGWLEYATSLYRRETARTLLDQYLALLKCCANAPDSRLSDLVDAG